MNVIDVNDQIPKFVKTVYQAEISEDQDVGSLITRVTANDGDSGMFVTSGDILIIFSFIIPITQSKMNWYNMLSIRNFSEFPIPIVNSVKLT